MGRRKILGDHGDAPAPPGPSVAVAPKQLTPDEVSVVAKAQLSAGGLTPAAATAHAQLAQATAASALLKSSGISVNPLMLMLSVGASASAAAAVVAAATVPKGPPVLPEVTNRIDPDVQELCDNFNFEERQARRLNEIMKGRQDTFEGDMMKLWEKLEEARNPTGLLVVKMREMEEGTFIGKKCDKELNRLVKKYALDDEAEDKLSDILARHTPEKKAEYYIDLEKHFEVSSRPSAMAMLLLKKLARGDPLGNPSAPAPGSYLDKQNREKNRDRRSRSRSRRRDDRDRDDRRDRYSPRRSDRREDRYSPPARR